MKVLRLKKDIVIKAGTLLESVDNEERSYHNGNYGQLVSLGSDITGEIVIGADCGYPDQEYEWFDRVER